MNIEKMAKDFTERSFSGVSKKLFNDKMLTMLKDIVYCAYLKGAEDTLETVTNNK